MNKKILTIIAIIGVLLVLNISYAMTTASIDIKKNTSSNIARWDIHFENLGAAFIDGNAIELTKPYITSKSTSISNINVKFQQNNDSIYYTFDVVNKGNLDAEISYLYSNKPKCIGNGNNALEDAKTVCENFKYDLTYEDGQNIQEGDILQKKERKRLKFRLYFEGDDFPIEKVDISNIKVAIVYSQK